MRVVAIEAVDPVLRVDRHRTRLHVQPLRRLLPVLAHPIVIFDRDGKFLSSWGAGLFKFPHAIRIVQENGEDRVWLCDEHHNQFYKFTTDGKLLQTIGEKGARSDTGVPDTEWSAAAFKQVTHGGGPFNLPTDIAFAPDGSMFMTDGYGNARVHKFATDMRLLVCPERREIA